MLINDALEEGRKETEFQMDSFSDQSSHLSMDFLTKRFFL